MRFPMKYRIFALAVALMGCAALVRAQQPLRLQIAGGHVTLHADNVPVRTILAEWARLGGAKILNGERVAGAPVTLDLEGVPERQALDILLRGVSGYMLAAREPGAAGASMYDRIMILPTSTAPRNPPPASAAPIFPNAPGGIVRPVAPRVPDDQDADDTPNGISGDGDGVPIPRPVTLQRPTPNPVGAPVMPLPPVSVADDTPQPQTPPGVVATPSNPFGLPPGSSLRPGIVVPAPQPQTPNQPPGNGPAN
jgi:hypothetical protein